MVRCTAGGWEIPRLRAFAPISWKAEFNDQVHEKGTLSMARLDDPDSANTSFFIVTARSPVLDGKYTVFGRVVSGLDVVERIESVAVNGETPVERVELRRVRVEKP